VKTPGLYRDVQEVLHQRGIQVSYETLREWCSAVNRRFLEVVRVKSIDVAAGKDSAIDIRRQYKAAAGMVKSM